MLENIEFLIDRFFSLLVVHICMIFAGGVWTTRFFLATEYSLVHYGGKYYCFVFVLVTRRKKD